MAGSLRLTREQLAIITRGDPRAIKALEDFFLALNNLGAHAANHEPGGTDPMAVDAVAATGSLRTLGTGAAQAAAGNHAHFDDAEGDPVDTDATAASDGVSAKAARRDHRHHLGAHASTHASGGADVLKMFNQATAAQGPGFASDTYISGSDILIPAGRLQAGTRYHLVFDVSKTAAGVATPIITVRFGVNGTTGDAARLTFTFTAQTAADDIGTFEVWATFRSVGAAGVLQGCAQVRHRLDVTGLANIGSTTLQVTSAGFDTTVAASIIGASVNGGASAAWTVQLVQAEMENLT